MRTRDRLAVTLLVALSFVLVFYRVYHLRRGPGNAMPVRHHELTLDMELYGHGDDVVVRTYLPLDTGRQSVRDELVSSGPFRFHVERESDNRQAVWERSRADGPQSVTYSCVVRTLARRYELAPSIEIPTHYPSRLGVHLESTDRIQSAAPEVRDLLARIVPAQQRGNATEVLRAIFDYTHGEVRSADYQGTTDALTCLRLGESSCGGKTRLFVALARAAGIPARTVGGLILKEGSWRAGHIWAEAWVGGHWVPFCPLNGYFAEVPDRYLATYVGDLPQFTHNRDVNFRYGFSGKRILAPPADWSVTPPRAWTEPLSLWAAFERIRIPVNLLKIILMLPFGALVVVLCRNVIGIETFGTFMPALMAVAFRDTGLLWGAVLLALIIGTGALVRFGLGRFQLLHTPRLAVILTSIVIVILGLGLAGRAVGLVLPTRVSLFPLAILTLTVERFSILVEEEGARRAAGVTLGTLVVVALAYLVMDWERLQVALLTFPELLLLVVAAFFVTGRWTGMRLAEYLRFRELIPSGGDA